MVTVHLLTVLLPFLFPLFAQLFQEALEWVIYPPHLVPPFLASSAAAPIQLHDSLIVLGLSISISFTIVELLSALTP